MGKLQDIFFALSNPNRIQIYTLCLKENISITELSKKVNISYRATLSNLKVLQDAGMIEIKETITEKGKEHLIKSIPLPKTTVYYNVYQRLLEEMK